MQFLSIRNPYTVDFSTLDPQKNSTQPNNDHQTGNGVTSATEIKSLIGSDHYDDRLSPGENAIIAIRGGFFPTANSVILSGLSFSAGKNDAPVTMPENVTLKNCTLTSGHILFFHGDLTATTKGTIATACGQDAVANADAFGAVANADADGAVANADAFGAVANANTFGSMANANEKEATANANADRAVANANAPQSVAHANTFGSVANANECDATAIADAEGATANANVDGSEAIANKNDAVAYACADGSVAYATEKEASAIALTDGACAVACADRAVAIAAARNACAIAKVAGAKATAGADGAEAYAIVKEASATACAEGAMATAYADGAVAIATIKGALAIAKIKGAVAVAQAPYSKAIAEANGSVANADANDAVANANATKAVANANAPASVANANAARSVANANASESVANANAPHSVANANQPHAKAVADADDACAYANADDAAAIATNKNAFSIANASQVKIISYHQYICRCKADSGDTHAAVIFGLSMIAEKYASEAAIQEGLRYLADASENGEKYASYYLGKIYLKGTADLIHFLPNPDRNPMRYSYSDLVESIKSIIPRSNRVKQDIGQAITFLSLAHRQGHRDAAFLLGELNASRAESEEAIKWYTEALNVHHPQAHEKLEEYSAYDQPFLGAMLEFFSGKSGCRTFTRADNRQDEDINLTERTKLTARTSISTENRTNREPWNGKAGTDEIEQI